MSDKKWYIIHTYSGYEATVKAALEKRIADDPKIKDNFGEMIIPQETIPTEKDGENIKKGRRPKKLFPGYILIEMKMSNEVWHIVNKTPKVTGFLGDANKPIPIRASEVAKVKQQLNKGVLISSETSDFEKGNNVKIMSGPFTDFLGVIDDVKPDKKKVRVLVSIFGRSTPIDLEYNQVEKIK